jgi:hypothetical protein
LADIIKVKALRNRKALLSYLDQENFKSTNTCGVVDLGWRGSIQDLLNKILKYEKTNLKIQGFYFGLHTNSYKESKNKHCFLYAKHEVDSFDRYKRFQFIMELLCSADHPTVIGYHANNKVSPVFKNNSSQWIVDWGISSLQKGILKYLDILTEKKYFNILKCNPKLYKHAFIQSIMFLIFSPNQKLI